MPKKASLILVVVLALVLSVTTYAFAAANTVPNTAGGDGTGTIAGYDITNVTYTLDSSNTDITKVSFSASTTVSPAPTAPVFKVLIAPGTTWVTCVDGSVAGTYDCSGTFGTVKAATSLRVVAIQ
jgi:hypothetical protein